MSSLFWVLVQLLMSGLLAIVCQGVAIASQACIKCHAEYDRPAQASSPAVLTCVECHDAADAGVTPHRRPGRLLKSQIAQSSQSCLSCHRKDDHAATRHGSIGAACTGCHDSHSAKHGKPLADDVGALCEMCHPAKNFRAKFTHKPVVNGDCGDCHALHAAENKGLLTDPVTKTCLGCHERVKKRPHAATGTSGKSHPIGDDRQELPDPALPGAVFSCSSCHTAHMSEQPKLMKFDLRSVDGFCLKCHRI